MFARNDVIFEVYHSQARVEMAQFLSFIEVAGGALCWVNQGLNSPSRIDT